MVFGFLNTQWVDLPPTVDESYIAQMTAGSGWAFGDLISEIDSRFTAFNSTMDPLVALLSSETQEAFLEYMDPVAFKIQSRGQFGMNRAQFTGIVGGYMLPTRWHAAATGWTEDGLRKTRLQTILNNVDGMLLGFRNQFRRDAMRRLFGAQEDAVEPGATTAKSPGLAGSGSGDNVYDRPYPSGAALEGGYTHYIRTASGALDTAIADQILKLKKQGIEGPYDVIGSASAIAAITASSLFTKTGSTLIRLGPNTAEALVDPATYVGVHGTEVRVRPAIPDFTDVANFALFKVYGPLDPRNPLAIRYPIEPGLPAEGKAAYIRSRNFYPLSEAEAFAPWAFGIGNRVGAILFHIDSSGSYDAPTISD